jgi:hypothetical protein
LPVGQRCSAVPANKLGEIGFLVTTRQGDEDSTSLLAGVSLGGIEMLEMLKRFVLSFLAMNWVKRNLDFFASLDDEEFDLDEEVSHMKFPPLSKKDLADMFEADWEFDLVPQARK